MSETVMRFIPAKNYQALIVALVLYVIMSPLGTYNTFAMFGLVESRFVPVQMGITAIMIVFAIIASAPIGHHCRMNATLSSRSRFLWLVGFYVIGPPVLYVYYRWKLIPSILGAS